MITSEHTEINDLIGRLWEQMGGVGTKDDLLVHLRPTLPDHLRDYIVEQGLAAKVGGFFRQVADNGMPEAPAIDGHGTHKQLVLLDVSEYRYLIAQRMKSSRADRIAAERFRDECMAVHGVLIRIEDPYAETVAS